MKMHSTNKIISTTAVEKLNPNLKKVFLRTLGCQMNVYDSDKVIDLLDTWGITPVEDEYEADILLVNTCSIREKAQEKVFHQLGRWKKIKDKKPVIIGVLGCVASQESEFILKRANYVDIILGPQTIHKILDSLNHITEKNKPYINVEFPEIEKFDSIVPSTKPQLQGLVSIMEGCNKYCSYCIVPYTRGTEFSRSFDSVMDEVKKLVESGSKEIHLLGQNVNAYRSELDGKELGIEHLIREIAKIDDVKRIRFTTSHPFEFSDALVDTFRDVPKLVDFLHLPVQHASNDILRAMKRDYTIEEYLTLIEKLRKIRPTMTFSSDFIVGFPNETAQDFEKLLNLVKEVKFDISYSFIYSKRPGTPAADLPDNVDMKTKKERLATLQHLLNNEAMIISRQMLGQVYPILVTGHSTKGYENQWQGRTENNRIVNFKLPNNQDMTGKFARVRIVDVSANSLFGELAED